MELNRNDLGGEIISILTKGMYPDPKDALREYVQNGVDAGAKNIKLKIRQDSIVIEDDGSGMDYEVLRNSVRVGISEKNPAKKVGFMGIGIYSSFHLCDKITIYSRGEEDIPNKLEMNFGGMREKLEDQKEKRIKKKINTEDLVDLQTLLEQYITITANNTLDKSDFPSKGTRIELTGLENEFYTALSDFDSVSNYLQNVIPLPFDKENFSYAAQIQKKITDTCKEYGQKFQIVNLHLQINAQSEDLYRPYIDEEFNKEKTKPFQPRYYVLKDSKEFYGIAWGCLNSQRRQVLNENLRGFVLKKQGFSIGKRSSMIQFFPNKNKYFDRYSGEIIIVNENLIPNASRTELEYSSLRMSFYKTLISISSKFEEAAQKYQEESKADDELSKLKEELQKEIGAYNENEGSPQVLVNKLVKVKEIIDKLSSRISRKRFSEQSLVNAKAVLHEAKGMESVYQNRLNALSKEKSNKRASHRTSSPTQIAKRLSSLKIDKLADKKKYESLVALLADLEFNVDEELGEVLDLIDEMFISRLAKSSSEYYSLMNELKEAILNSQ